MSDNQPTVYRAITDPETKLILNVAGGKGPSRVLISYIKGNLRRLWSKNSLEKQALARPIDNLIGLSSDVVGAAAYLPSVALASKLGIKHPAGRFAAGMLGSYLAANASARLGKGLVAATEQTGHMPRVLTEVDPNSATQILMGNGGSLAGGLIGLGIASPVLLNSAYPTLLRIGTASFLANRGMTIGETTGTMAGHIVDRIRSNQNPVVEQQEPA